MFHIKVLKEEFKMSENWKNRTELLIGKDAVEKLAKAKVIIYGIGGVGSFTTEALARAGIGNLTLVDNDVISLTNINRQIHSNINTVGKSKIEVMKKRILEINPEAKVEIYNPKEIDLQEELLINTTYDYVVDAVDTVSTKIRIIETAKKQNIKVISAMGTGNKIEPTKFEVADISKTSVCPLAKVMRKELKKRGIKGVKVVYSKEEPKVNERTPASKSFMPSVSGLIIAGEIIKDIIKE